MRTRDVIDGYGGPQLGVHGMGGKTKVVPITDNLANAIRAGHLTAAHVGKLVTSALRAGWTMHKLWQRFATRAYRGGRNLRVLQLLLVHTSIATTERYTAVDDDEIRAAAMAGTSDD